MKVSQMLKQSERKLDQAPTFWQVFQSVLAAIFGVQKEKNRDRDFEHGKAWQFIAMGIVVVLALLCILYGIMRLVVAVST